MKWLLISVILNSHNTFELKVVDHFATEAECKRMIVSYKLPNPYLACLDRDAPIMEKSVIHQEKIRLEAQKNGGK